MIQTIYIFVIAMSFFMVGWMVGCTVGSAGSEVIRPVICKQAYAAKVDQQIEACRAWKAEIDKDIEDKLGVKK